MSEHITSSYGKVSTEMLVERVKAVQELRPLLLKQLGYVPECVLDYCNKNRALLRELGEIE